MSAVQTFQDFILMAPPNVQSWLISIFQFIENEFPQAEQRLYHALPTFFLKEKDIINIGVYKDHISLYVGYDIVDYLKQVYPAHSYTKGTISFSYTEPFTLGILKDICSQIKAAESTAD